MCIACEASTSIDSPLATIYICIAPSHPVYLASRLHPLATPFLDLLYEIPVPLRHTSDSESAFVRRSSCRGGLPGAFSHNHRLRRLAIAGMIPYAASDLGRYSASGQALTPIPA